MRHEKPKILVVDDNPNNLQVVGSILSDNGYELVVTMNGRQALDFLAKDTVELILLDVMMPEMDGFEVCRNIKNDKNLKDIPVIFLTAKTRIEDLLQGFELGAVDYICKPFNTFELLARIKLQLELKWAREEIRTLRGILPVCCVCDAIRDDTGFEQGKGVWMKIDEFINKRTGAQITHGYCPKCFDMTIKKIKSGQ